jgi:hypothetical protein
LLASLFTSLNAYKPLHIDDAAYYYYARQIEQHPCNPYGFWLIWYDEPNEANDILAPPVLPAWWALQIKLFGQKPWAWKLGLLPWCLLLTLALHALFRRFAPGLQGPLTWLTMLSPALLPSLNLMLDVPALALALVAVCLFLSACDRNSLALAFGTGLLAGIATETKYTAFLAPGVMLLAAATRKRWHLWPLALLATLAVFSLWELLTAVLYGRSHFLNSLWSGVGLSDKLQIILPLFGQLGGTLPAVTLFGLAALGSSRRWLLSAAVVVVLGFILVAVLDIPFERLEFSPLPAVKSIRLPAHYQIAHTVFFLSGLGSAVVVGFVLVRLLADKVILPGWDRCDTHFLALWLALELVGYFALTPFGAARRVLGLTVILTLLTGRLAARALGETGRSAIYAVCGFGIVLGLVYYALDLQEAQVQQTAAVDAAAWINRQGGGRVWYVGHWGWQFHAERNGMEPVIVGYETSEASVPLPPPSRLQAGDWLVVPDERIHRQAIDLVTAPLREEIVLHYAAVIPLRTVACFYAGICPVEHHNGDRLTVHIYRVTSGFTPKKRQEE